MSSPQNTPLPATRNQAPAAAAGTAAPTPIRTALLVTKDDRPAPHIKPFTDALEAHGVTLIRRTPARAKINDLILSMRNQVDCVVLAGTDSMLGAGAIALRDTGLPLGILPHPNQDLARRLGIPPDPAAAAAIVLDGHKRRLNLGAVNGRPFFTVASIGLTVQDARLLNHVVDRPMGRLLYRWNAFRLLLHSARFAAIIRCGTAIHRVHTIQITIGNGHLYQGGMAPGTERPGGEDTLGVYSLEPTGRWQLLFLADAFIANDGKIVPEARIVHSPIVEIVTRLPRPITADGEIVAMTPARFSIIPRAVDVFVPASTPLDPPTPAETAPNPYQP